jgi:hypothetical protein
MTLSKDNKREKNLRPPMRRPVFWIWISAVVAVFIFVGVVLAVSGQSWF